MKYSIHTSTVKDHENEHEVEHLVRKPETSEHITSCILLSKHKHNNDNQREHNSGYSYKNILHSYWIQNIVIRAELLQLLLIQNTIVTYWYILGFLVNVTQLTNTNFLETTLSDYPKVTNCFETTSSIII